MIQMITKHRLEHVLKNPTQYIDDEHDEMLLKFYEHGGDVNNPVCLTLGMDIESSDGEVDNYFYIKEHDNDAAIYHHCTESEVNAVFGQLMLKLVTKERG